MKLRCPDCDTLNDDARQTCIEPDCGASLRFAEQIEEPRVSADEAAHDAIASNQHPEAFCECKYSDPDPVSGICQGCDAPVKLQPAPAEEAPIRARLVLPDGSALNLVSGVTVGRNAAETRNALLCYDGVSRTHLWLAQQGDELLVIDLGSRNGTWIGNQRLLPHALHRYPLAGLFLHIRLGHKAQLQVIWETTP